VSAPKSFQNLLETAASGNVGYRLDMDLVGGKRVFKSFPTREKTEAAQRKLRKELAAKKSRPLADIDASTRHEILRAVESP